MEVCFLMVEKAPFGVCYDCYTSAVFGQCNANTHHSLALGLDMLVDPNIHLFTLQYWIELLAAVLSVDGSEIECEVYFNIIDVESLLLLPHISNFTEN